MAKKSSEAAPIYCVKRGESLVGEMQYDRDRIAAMPAGERIKVELSTGRVPKRLRFYFVFLHKIVEATNCCPNERILHNFVKLRTGYTDEVLVDGLIYKVPASVSFENMDETTFGKFLTSALAFIASEFGITPEDVEKAA
ncbi:DUF1367 family protein [Rhizobium sp. YTUHZ044]|uniref:hypothetical protein n=1 Tax=Rhizobium sp. YTUHZ044 TaxID=2962678 RepID=UPI003DA86EAA